ncbi:MAG: SH3 domain-containing protein [Agrobacterium tumefaciens]
MKSLWFAAALAASAGSLPTIAEAASAFSTANVNMRSGPSTRYPAVIVIPSGSRVNVQGCLSSANWCDVAFAGYRGWVSGSYLQTTYSQRRVRVAPQYYRPLGIPTVTFSIGRYWDDHYRGRPFYRDRDRWRDGDGWRDDRRDRGRDRDRRAERRDRDDDRRFRRDGGQRDNRDRNLLQNGQDACDRDVRRCR